LLYNYFIRSKGLTSKYENIQEGDKIKFIYLKEPNPIGGGRGDKVISFPTKLPKELDLHRFIDYDKQFNTSFLDPLVNILNVVNWKSKQEASLEDFFS